MANTMTDRERYAEAIKHGCGRISGGFWGVPLYCGEPGSPRCADHIAASADPPNSTTQGQI